MKVLFIIISTVVSHPSYCQQLVDYQVQHKPLPLFDEPNGRVITKVPKNKTIKLVTFDDRCNCFSAEYKETKGFLPSAAWLNDIFKEPAGRDSNEYVTKVLKAHDLILDMNENGAFILVRRPENNSIIQRKAIMTRKYGYTDGKKISEGKLWLGMNTEMALDSWGIPYRVRRFHGNWGEQEQWIYSSAYLYFENGLLTEILKISKSDN